MNMIDPASSIVSRLDAYYEWVSCGTYKIKDKHGHLIQFKMRPVQRRLLAQMRWLAKQGKPIRIQILKARKEGISTLIQTLAAFLAQWTPHWYSVTVAHTQASTFEIHGISKRLFTFCEYDPKPSANGNPIEFAHDSSIQTCTAGGQYVMSGSTINLGHFSELPKWEGNVEDQLASLFGSVPKVQESFVFIEGTANMRDVSGEFQERWDQAVSGKSPFIPFFSPWFEDPEYRLRGVELETLNDYEKWLVEKFSVDHEQLAWRRETLAADYHGNELFFKQEYPATPEEAFQSPAGLIYPMLNEIQHDRAYTIDTLLDDGFTIYRGIDWGGADPFVCLFVAHKPGDPALTIDKEACPNTWREHARYCWATTRSGMRSKPIDRDDHTCDALRYVQQQFNLEGHMHVFGEIYDPDFAAAGRSLLDMATDVKSKSKGIPISDTVADRGRPDSIRLMCNQGVFCSGVAVPEKVTERGEKIDGIERIRSMLVATLPMSYAPKPPSPLYAYMMQQAEMPINSAIPTVEGALAMQRYAKGGNQFVNPIFGACV